MDLITIIVIAFGLAIDAFTVSTASGITVERPRINNALTIALFFGLFQAIMPLIGWLSGLVMRDLISVVDHWIAFGLLCLIGCKMIYESGMKESIKRVNPLNIYILLGLSIATSIDALAVGLSFAFLRTAIVIPMIVIGIITFLLSFLGFITGNRFGNFFKNKIGIVGGLVLIGIGIKILVDHLVIPF